MGVTCGVFEAVSERVGVSLGGGVTSAPPISAFSVANRSRPGVTGRAVACPAVGDGVSVAVMGVSVGWPVSDGVGLARDCVTVGLPGPG